VNAWLALLWTLVLGCGRPVDPAAGSPDAIFPHPTDYAHGTHGADALAADATCSSCHGIELDEVVRGTRPAAPACKSCHSRFPHDADMDQGAVHAPLWAAPPDDDPQAMNCTDCHGDRGERAPAGLARGQCTSCHSAYPHPDGWKEPALHGPAAREHGGGAGCAGCHTDVNDDTDPGACATCHAAYPHPEGWEDPAIHSAAYTPDACGVTCHDLQSPFTSADPKAENPGAGKLACASCHDLFPHPADMQTRHIGIVQDRGQGTCLICHEDGEAGPTLPVACAAACHGGGTP